MNIVVLAFLYVLYLFAQLYFTFISWPLFGDPPVSPFLLLLIYAAIPALFFIPKLRGAQIFLHFPALAALLFAVFVSFNRPYEEEVHINTFGAFSTWVSYYNSGWGFAPGQTELIINPLFWQLNCIFLSLLFSYVITVFFRKPAASTIAWWVVMIICFFAADIFTLLSEPPSYTQG